MKIINKVLMAAVGAFALTTVNYAKADGPLLSPRAQGNQIHIVAGSSVGDPDLLANRQYGSASARGSVRSAMKAPGTNTTDLAHGPRPTMSPKDPRYAQSVREMREVQVAPLK